MNIAVIGGDGVGKSTFVQGALDLPFPAPAKAADRKIPYDGTLYRIRLLEISIDDVDIDDDDTVSWPDIVADRITPHIDGVLTLYDVSDRASIEDVPETLCEWQLAALVRCLIWNACADGVITAAIHKAALPCVLISCKCDTPPAERELDPVGIEARAKQAVKSLRAVQTSLVKPESFKMGLATLVKAVVNGHPGKHHRVASHNCCRVLTCDRSTRYERSYRSPASSIERSTFGLTKSRTHRPCSCELRIYRERAQRARTFTA